MHHASTLSSKATTTEPSLRNSNPKMFIWTTLLVFDIVIALFFISLSGAPHVSSQNYSDDDAALGQQTVSASFIGS